MLVEEEPHEIRVALAIIGAASAGLPAAQVAPNLGLNAALIERHRLGGDCLWTGCVPSKALIASAKAVHIVSNPDNLRRRCLFGR